MLDLRRLDVDIALCVASKDALDRLVAPGFGSSAFRTAADELLVIADAGLGPDILRELADRVPVLDPDAIVMDVSDGWACLSLRGTGARDAFATVSWLDLPEPGGWIQGDVAGTAAKVRADVDGLDIIVPAYHEAHLRDRLLADAGATEVVG